MSGSIIIKPLNASLSRDLDTFSKMDPYTIVKLGAQAQSTKVCKDGGQHPSWNSVCVFRRSNEQLLEFEIWDKDELTKNDLIRQGTFAVAQLEQYATFNGHIPLKYKGKSAGNLQVSIEFIRNGVPGQFPQGVNFFLLFLIKANKKIMFQAQLYKVSLYHKLSITISIIRLQSITIDIRISLNQQIIHYLISGSYDNTIQR